MKMQTLTHFNFTKLCMRRHRIKYTMKTIWVDKNRVYLYVMEIITFTKKIKNSKQNNEKKQEDSISVVPKWNSAKQKSSEY